MSNRATFHPGSVPLFFFLLLFDLLAATTLLDCPSRRPTQELKLSSSRQSSVAGDNYLRRSYTLLRSLIFGSMRFACADQLQSGGSAGDGVKKRICNAKNSTAGSPEISGRSVRSIRITDFGDISMSFAREDSCHRRSPLGKLAEMRTYAVVTN